MYARLVPGLIVQLPFARVVMSETARFIVIAEFQLKEGQQAAFLGHAHEDASASLANEPGCHQFDVLTTPDDDCLVVLHEAYTDRAAFDTHTQMPHYAPFKDATGPMLAAPPTVRFFERN